MWQRHSAASSAAYGAPRRHATQAVPGWAAWRHSIILRPPFMQFIAVIRSVCNDDWDGWTHASGELAARQGGLPAGQRQRQRRHFSGLSAVRIAPIARCPIVRQLHSAVRSGSSLRYSVRTCRSPTFPFVASAAASPAQPSAAAPGRRRPALSPPARLNRRPPAPGQHGSVRHSTTCIL